MPVYKGDQVTVDGKVVDGEIDNSDILELDFKAGQTLTVGEVKYEFVSMHRGKFMYRKVKGGGEKAEPEPVVIVDPPAEESDFVDTAATMLESDLPRNAILDEAYISNEKWVYGIPYKLMKPLTKVGDKYVYIPA